MRPRQFRHSLSWPDRCRRRAWAVVRPRGSSSATSSHSCSTARSERAAVAAAVFHVDPDSAAIATAGRPRPTSPTRPSTRLPPGRSRASASTSAFGRVCRARRVRRRNRVRVRAGVRVAVRHRRRLRRSRRRRRVAELARPQGAARARTNALSIAPALPTQTAAVFISLRPRAHRSRALRRCASRASAAPITDR